MILRFEWRIYKYSLRLNDVLRGAEIRLELGKFTKTSQYMQITIKNMYRYSSDGYAKTQKLPSSVIRGRVILNI